MQITKDIRPVIGSLAWSWLLAFIPTLIIWLSWTTIQFRVDGNSLEKKAGLLSKQTTNVDLSKVQTISTEESLLKGGTLVVHTNVGTESFAPIKNPGDVATQLRQQVEGNKNR